MRVSQGLTLLASRFFAALIVFIASLHLSESSVLNMTEVLRSSPSILYVWSGQDASVNNAADFVAVIDFDELSSTYGKILRVVPLVSDASNGVGQANNEPHHSGISADGQFFITGGLLSFLSGNKEIFIWKIPKNPLDGPKFLCAIDAPGSACTDEFQPVGPHSFLVSMMCNENANSPGDMVLVNADDCTVTSFLQDRNLPNFNPHGFGILSNGSIFTADYIVPITLTETDPSKIVFQSTVRHFFPDGSLQRTFNFPYPTNPETGLGSGIGFMELKAIPNDPLGRAYACGTNTNLVYLITPGIQEPVPVLDASVVNGYDIRPSAGIIAIFESGELAIMSFQMRFLLLVDIRVPENPNILHTFDFCTHRSISHMPIQIHGTSRPTTFPEFCASNGNNTGTHVVMLPPGENRFIVLNYFLQFGLAQFSGTRSMHAFKLDPLLTSFSYDHRFNPNFPDTHSHFPTFYSMQAHPHHADYIKL